MKNLNHAIVLGGVLVILALLAAGVVVAAASRTPAETAGTRTLPEGNYLGAFISVRELSQPNSTLSTGYVKFTFVVSSGAVGTFDFGVAKQGATLPPEAPVGETLELPLPSSVSVSFLSPTVINDVHNATVTFEVAAVNTPSGAVIPLEFVVLQDQGQGLTAETAYPINLGAS